MSINEIDDNLRKKVLDRESPEDILALAHEEGYELSDEEMEDVAGSGKMGKRPLPPVRAPKQHVPPGHG